MASFINHKTSLSRLQAQFQDVYAQFTVHDDNDAADSSPQDFLNDQSTRIVQTEQRLLRLTHRILPDAHELTGTEVARAVHELQTRYLAQLTAAQRRVMPPPAKAIAKAASRVPQHWSVGRILTAVPETEHETDSSVVTTGKSTASSTFFPSPAFVTTAANSSSKRRSRLPPPRAADLLPEHQRATEEMLGNSPRYNQCFEEEVAAPYDDEDEPVTAALPRSPQRTSTERRVDAFTELEERLRQDIHQAQQTAHQAAQDAAQEEEEEETFQLLSIHEEESMTVETETPTVVANRSTVAASMIWDDGDATQDDSALDCPTVLHQTTPRHHRPQLQVRGMPRPSHIEFDPRAEPVSPSMSTINLTLDEELDDLTAHLDHALAGLATVPEHDDNLSLGSQETHVLDRYRLAPDAQAPHGFVVVPNPRRRPLPVLARRGGVPTKDKSLDKVAHRDENAPVNLAEKRSMRLLGETRARGPGRRPLAISHLESVEVKGAHPSPTASLARSQRQASPRGLPSLQPHTAGWPSPRGPRAWTPLVPISSEEYEASPRVVKMQVSLVQVQEAILLWNSAGRPGDGTATTRAVTDAQVAKVWQPLKHGTSDRQRQTLLMSLCHWRRLVMRRTPTGTVYEVVVPVSSGMGRRSGH